MEMIQAITLGLSFLQEVGTVWIVNDLPMLEPAFVVQDQLGGWALMYESTEQGLLGG